MELTAKGIENRAEWEAKGYSLPKFELEKVTLATKENPTWVHFGAGNIFRAFQANVAQNLLDEGILDKGIIVAEGFDFEIIEKMNRTHDELTILVTLKSNGTVDKTVIASVVESCILDSENDSEFGRMMEIFKNPSLQMASFTITEKGYSLIDGNGNYLGAVRTDFESGPKKPMSYIGKVVSLLYTRFKAGAYPIAMVSMDNCSHNGDKLFAAVKTFADKWIENGLADAGFADYIADRSLVSFPWSMIDKITPRPDDSIRDMLRADGISGLEPVITAKSTYVAPFVNAEECEYLVIEDSFPNGRPPLEKGGMIFTDRETVDKVEKMKVCTCLNPLHTALAVYGCLLGYKKISDEMKDEALVKLVKIIGYREGLPVVVNPGILDPKEFIDTVLSVRVPNPFMPDTPQRIATDTSQKLAIRFGETIKNYAVSNELDAADLKFIPFVFAGWLRYLLAVDDDGKSFELSPDPLLTSVCPKLNRFTVGSVVTVDEALEELRSILSDAKIFGVDLYEVGLARMVAEYFVKLIADKGAVRKTLNSLTEGEVI